MLDEISHHSGKGLPENIGAHRCDQGARRGLMSCSAAPTEYRHFAQSHIGIKRFGSLVSPTSYCIQSAHV
ncbi:hypothetical protein FPL00_11870 [Xanthomonas citri pv. glycines]|uniref:hypothetical protein n=1 Tax=Xanthomonas cissicola TaxID=86186 RepID=UPI0002DA7EB1|nr:hypothetical protein [Xanthomonas cissicola]QDS07477.1 hypothetical protein FPL00_11870 [Xanthomonas citri pv. glycines]